MTKATSIMRIITVVITVVYTLSGTLFAQHSMAEYISEIAPPNVIKETRVIDGNRTLLLDFPRLYVVNQWAGLQIVNVADAANPKTISTLRTIGRAYNVAKFGEMLLISDDAAGVVIVDIADINSPKKIGNIRQAHDTYWVTVKDSFAILAHGKNGFSIWDITDPLNVVKVSEVKTFNWAWRIVVAGNLLYVADNNAGLLIYDIADMNSPKLLGRYRSKNLVRSVVIEGNYAFVADGPGGMKILNVENPTIPTKISDVKTDGFVYSLFKSGQYVFMADEKKGLVIVNVEDVNKPFVESNYKATSDAFDVWKQNIYVYLCTDQKTIILRHNNPPKLLAVGDRQGAEDQMLTIQLQGSDPDNDPIIYAAENLPEGAVFNPDAGYLEWTPTFDQAGSYNNVVFKIIEKTDTRLEDKDTITINISNVNRVPVLSALEPVTVKENQTLTVVVPEGSDPDKEDAGRLVYIAENVPQGADFDPASRTLSWTPTYEQSGVYLVDILLQDPGELVARQTMQITVEHVDRSPIITTVEDKTVDENALLQFTVEGEDPDKEDVDRLQFIMENLPEGALFDPVSRVFSWTPTYDQSGVYKNVVAKIVSGPKSDSTVFSITVNHVNRAPLLAEIPAQTVNENTELTFTVSGSDPDVEDEGKLLYSLNNLPQGASFDEKTGVFLWKPTFEQSGTYALTFAIKDPSGLQDAKETIITVNHVNRHPQLAAIGEKTIDENSRLAFVLEGSDPDVEDEGKLRYAGLGMPDGMVLNDVSGEVEWIPTYDQSGVYDFLFTVSDGQYADSQKVKITVNHVNRPPVLQQIAEQTVDENITLVFRVSGSDPDVEDKGKLLISASNLPEGAEFNAENGDFSWTPTYEQSGNYTVTFTITDPSGLTDKQDVPITVNHINRPPVIEAVAAQTVDENETLTVKLIGSDPDKEDQGRLKYYVKPMPEGAQLNVSDGTFVWTPTYEQSGVYDLTFGVNDWALNAETGATITVNHVNRPPQIGEVSPMTVKENSEFTFTVPVSDPDKEDAGKLTLKVNGLPEGASFTPLSNTIKWLPGFDNAGNYSFELILSDPAGLTDTKTLNLSVLNVNRAPELVVPAEISGNENEKIGFSVEAKDPDKEDKGKLKVTYDKLPSGAVFETSSNSFSWVPSFDQAGNYTVKFTATDVEGLSNAQEVVLKVTNVNRKPELEPIRDVKIKEGKEWKLKIKVSDPDKEDKNKLKFEVGKLPKGCKFDGNSGEFKWKPTFEQAGNYTFNVTVKDNEGLTATQSFSISVENVNRKPKIESPSSLNVEAGKSIGFTVKFKDEDKDDNLTLEASGVPANAFFDVNSGKFSWKTSAEDAGNYIINIKVKDSSGGEDNVKVKINVKKKETDTENN